MNHKSTLLLAAIAGGLAMVQPVQAANYVTNFKAEIIEAKASAVDAESVDTSVEANAPVSATVMPVTETPDFFSWWDDGSAGGSDEVASNDDTRNTTPGFPSPDEGPVSSDGPVE